MPAPAIGADNEQTTRRGDNGRCNGKSLSIQVIPASRPRKSISTTSEALKTTPLRLGNSGYDNGYTARTIFVGKIQHVTLNQKLKPD
jgi:hypothetical protein